MTEELSLEEQAAQVDNAADDAAIAEDLAEVAIVIRHRNGTEWSLCIGDLTAAASRRARAACGETPEALWTRWFGGAPLTVEELEHAIRLFRAVAGEEDPQELGIRRRDIVQSEFVRRSVDPNA